MTADAELRHARRARVFDAMDAAGLDVLVLGRRDDVAYATGARSLWTAGTRPFGTACVLVAAGRSTHLLSTWDEGVPPEIPFEDLYGLTWNPATMASALRSIPGLGDARRIGVDAVSPGFQRAVPRLAPDAELVAADDLVRAVRAVKLPGEVARIRAATAVCDAAVDAAADALAGGGSLALARAVALRAAAGRGVTVPTSGIVVEPAAPGDVTRVHVDVGLLADGYEGGRGRTVIVGADARHGGVDVPATVERLAADDADAGDAALRRLMESCRAGVTGNDLRAAASGATGWMVRGSGMGFEEPVVTGDLGADAVLRAGMVLSVEVEVGPWRRRHLVAVEAQGPATLL